MSTIDFVYFDLDDTLLDHTYAERTALESMVLEQPETFGHSPFVEVLGHYRSINPIVWQKYSKGEFTKEQAKIGRFEELLAACNSSLKHEAPQVAQRYLDTYANHWKAVDGAVEAFLETASSIPVGILTNGFAEVQRAKLAQFSAIQQVAKAVVISEEIGHLKPSPILFQHAAAQAGTAPQNILYVGDSFTSDVEGGIGAGWKVAWYSEKTLDHPDVWSFSNWGDFIDKLDIYKKQF